MGNHLPGVALSAAYEKHLAYGIRLLGRQENSPDCIRNVAEINESLSLTECGKNPPPDPLYQFEKVGVPGAEEGGRTDHSYWKEGSVRKSCLFTPEFA